MIYRTKQIGKVLCFFFLVNNITILSIFNNKKCLKLRVQFSGIISISIRGACKGRRGRGRDLRSSIDSS